MANATGGAQGASPSIGITRWTRLMPIAMIVYIISFMDRTNISYAFEGIGREFNVGRAEQGFLGGVFFLGYVLLQIPGGYLAERWSARKFVGIMIILWGIFATLCGFARSFEELVVYRFFLGVAEGGVWPATLVLISHWFPTSERARAYGFWMTNLAIASIITQPLSGFIVNNTGWRELFIIEGILPFLVAAPVWWGFVKDRPSEASWVEPAEREWIEREVAKDRAGQPERVPFKSIFTSSTVWRLTLVYFLIQVGFYGLNMWLPTVVRDLTNQGFGAVGLIAALPYVVAIAALWLNGWWADRTRRYNLHVLLAMLVAGISLVASVLSGPISTVLAVALLCLAMGGALGYDGPFWAAGSRAMPVVVAGGAMGLINALGNLGGYLGPFAAGYLQDASGGHFLTTSIFLAAALILAGFLMLTVRIDPTRAS